MDDVGQLRRAGFPVLPTGQDERHYTVVLAHLKDALLALLSDVTAGLALAAGDIVEVTDGEVTHLAVVDSVSGEIVSLVVLWDAVVPAA